MEFSSFLWIVTGLTFAISLYLTNAQICNIPCSDSQYCGNFTNTNGVTIPTCLGCNAACTGCKDGGAGQCKLCAPQFYNGTGNICRGCNVACSNCTGPGPEDCKLCAPGFYNVGGICRGCPDKTFGVNCTGICHCLGSDDCSKTDGSCESNQCDRGWQVPPTCQTPCESNKFGRDCQYECHCPVNDTCNSVNGLCSSGRCQLGYGGPGCQTLLPRLKDAPTVDAYCGRANITWRNWVQDLDIGKGPIAHYEVMYRINNDTTGWKNLRVVSYSATQGLYVVSHTNLNKSLEYKYRVDVRRQDGDKVMQEWVAGFETDYYSMECIATTTTTTTLRPPVTPSRPPPGSLFNSDFAVQYVSNNTIQVTWSTKSNYSDIVGNVTLTYGIIGIGDCQDVDDNNFTVLPVGKSGSVEIEIILWRKYRVIVEAETVYHNVSDADRRISLEFGPHNKPELQTVPTGPVLDIQVTGKTSQSATISWKLPLCEHRGGYLKQYDIQFRNINSGSLLQINSTNQTTVVLNSLVPYNNYGVKIRFVNVVGIGPYSSEVTFVTNEAEPAAPNITFYSSGIDEITLRYTTPSPTNGVIQGYQVSYSVRQDFSDITNKPANGTTYVITELKPNTMYYLKVRGKTNHPNWGKYSQIVNVETKEDYPTAPYNITVIFRNETCLGVTWIFQSSQNGKIVEYSIHYKDTTQDTDKKVKIVPAGTAGPHYICEMSPGTLHMVEVSAKTGRGYGPALAVFRTTEQATPPTPPSPSYINHTETTITVAIDPININTGPLSLYRIYVNDVTGVGRRKRQLVPPGNLTAEFSPSSITTRTYVRIGDGISNNGIVNTALLKNHQYEVYLQITSTLEGITKSSFSKMDRTVVTTVIVRTTAEPVVLEDNNTGVIIAIVVIIILLLIAIIIIVAVLCYKRRQSQQTYEPFQPEKEHIDMTKILRDSYDPHKYWNTIYSHRESRYIVAGRDLLPDDSLHANGTVGFHENSSPITFQQEFHDLPHGQLSSWNAALQRKNKNKNRFPHLLPYDHTRVLLNRDENSDVEYINANYIHGYKKSCAYIAAQSPFDDDTVLDFWRMLYQLDIKVVVMITNIVEDQIIKCTQYWPEPGQGRVTYGTFKLELIDYQEYADYIIRTVKIKTKSNAHTKVVHIFDFCSWPDHGVPDDPIPLLEMRHKVREYHSGTKTPIVVHCGTGVSRTGTFIAIDALLEQYQMEGRISVFSFVRKMRKDRVAMVRTVKQFIFIYETIFEARVAGDTRTGLDLKQRYHTLTMKNPKTKHSYLRDQFICLQRYTRALSPHQCSSALVPVNIDKNRFPDVVPPDSFRPHLITPGGLGRTDYVNAVFLDSHRYKNHFIVTQTPLHTTVIDFWKLVYDYNASTIVMMESYKHEDDTCAEYWPEKKMKKFEPFFVDNTEIYQQENVTIRHFKLSSMHKPSEPGRQIRQFQFNAWDDTDFIPKSKTMFLDLFDLVDDWQRVSNNHDKPIIVHCKDGATHSGLFCSAYVVCEAMREDGDVDVFHTVKHMKRRRSQIIDTADQYRYCYKVLWDFMNLRQEGGTLTEVMNHTSADKLYNVGSLSLPSYTSHLEYA